MTTAILLILFALIGYWWGRTHDIRHTMAYKIHGKHTCIHIIYKGDKEFEVNQN